MIKIQGLTHHFNQQVILNDLNLEVKSNSFHTIIGLNGVGKTLSLRLISNLEKKQRGTIEYQLKKISYVFQNAPFFSWLTIQKNLEICSDIGKEKLHELMVRWHLDKYAEMYPSELSGGVIQKVNLLRAFMQKSDLILMDEPFSHLDIIQKEELYSFTLSLLKEYQTTVILVTHDIDEALYLSTTISYLSKKTKNITKTFPVLMNKEDNFYRQKVMPAHLNYFSDIHMFLKGDEIL